MTSAILARLRAFFAFWYEFVVGDDWRLALGVMATLAALYAASRNFAVTWWLAPVAVLTLLGWSVARGARGR